MNFGDFLDIDRHLHLDPCAEKPVERLERDRRIGRALSGGGAATDQELLVAWKNEVEAPAGPTAGTLVAAALRWTVGLLGLAGLLLGIGAATGLLRYEGDQPINVLFFLAAIVGVQILFLPLLLLALLFRGRLRRGRSLIGALAAFLFEKALDALARAASTGREGAAAELRAELGRLQASNSFFRRVRPLLLFTVLQVFGVAFNTGVAATLLFFVLFTDLAFSWGTTLQVAPEQIHRLTTALALPWGEWLPQARPTLELVESTRFVRLNGTYVSEARDVAAGLRAGGWWPFLMAATLTYGLLPRALALAFGCLLLRLEMRKAIARSLEVRALKERLRTPLVRVGGETVSSEKESPSGGEAAAVSRSEKSATARGLDLAGIFWAYDALPPKGVAERLLREEFDARLVSEHLAGTLEGEEGLWPLLEEAKTEGKIAGAAVFFEPFEPPKADARRFLERLRERLGADAPILVVLVEFAASEARGAEPDERQVWERSVREMGDPFLLFAEGSGEG